MEVKDLILFYEESIQARKVYLQGNGSSLSGYSYQVVNTEIKTLEMVVNDLKKTKRWK